MNFSFNRSGYFLSITTKHDLEERVQFEIMQDPQVAAARPMKVTHWMTEARSHIESLPTLNAYVESKSNKCLLSPDDFTLQ